MISKTSVNPNWSFDEIRQAGCQNCSLHKSARTVCLTGQGPRDAVGVILGEGPGRREDSPDVRRPFSGKAGKLLDRLLAQVELSREELFVDNVTRCFPGDQNPNLEHAQACDFFTQTILQTIKPKFVLLLGDLASQHLAGFGKITKNRGRIIQRNGITYLVSIHPAYVLRNPGLENYLLADLKVFATMVRGRGKVKPTEVKIAETPERIQEAVEELSHGEFVAYDLETQGLISWDPHRKIWCIGLSNGESTWAIPWEHRDSTMHINGNTRDVHAGVKALLENPHLKKVAQNGGYDNRWLRVRHIYVKTNFDTMKAAHLLDENTTVGLKSLASRLFGVPDYSLNPETWEEDPEYFSLLYYAGLDAFYTARAYPILRREIMRDRSLARLLAWQMMPAGELLSRIEQRGMPVDGERLVQRAQANRDKRDELQEEMDGLLPDTFKGINWNSPPQVSRLFFAPDSEGGLGLTPVLKNKTGFSVNEEVLKRLKGQHRIVDLLLAQRTLEKRDNTFYGPWQENSKLDGNLHSSYNECGTVTGRVAASPIHQIPREPELRSVFGGVPGWFFVQGDESQSELRIASWYSDEPTMKEEFRQGIDPHLEAARRATGLLVEQITKEIRKKAKARNFGYLYGMGWKKYVRYAFTKWDIILTPEEGKQDRDYFFKHWPLLAEWHDRVRRSVHKYKQIVAPNGRIRRLPGVDSTDQGIRAEAERQGINSPVQGFSSDMVLMAGAELEGLIPGSDRALDLERAYTVGQVHEALQFMVRADYLVKACLLIKEVMEHPFLFDKFGIVSPVPFVADLTIGTHWADPKAVEWKGDIEVLKRISEQALAA